MRFILFFLLALSLSSLHCTGQASAKRKAPKEVTPVVVNDIRYTAPTGQMGYVIAKDFATDSTIWSRQIYKVRYNPFLEKDVQDIFIDSLYVKGDDLVIRTERGKIYSIRIKQ